MASKEHRTRLLSILSGKSLSTVEGLHLSDEHLCSRVVDATLPVLAAIEDARSRMPVAPPKDLLDVPGIFTCLGTENLSRHQSIALLTCLLSCRDIYDNLWPAVPVTLVPPRSLVVGR